MNDTAVLRQKFEDTFYPIPSHMYWNETANGYTQTASWAALPTQLQNARWYAWQKAAAIYGNGASK